MISQAVCTLELFLWEPTLRVQFNCGRTGTIGASKGLTSGSVDRHGQKESIRISGRPDGVEYPPIEEERDARFCDDETKCSILEERK